MDFGLARRIDKGDARLTQSGDVLGTPAYMPPEQVAGQLDQMGPACDIYSLGVILYELLTGRLPFDGPVMSVLALILTQEPEKPTAHRPGLNPQLEVICLKAMAKKAEERHKTIGELASALGDYLRQGSQVHASQAAGRSRAALQTSASVEERAGVSMPAQLFADLVASPVSIRPKAQDKGTARSPIRRIPWWQWVATGGAAAALILGIVIIIRTKSGTIKIETDDSDATVEIKQANRIAKEGRKTERDKHQEPNRNDAAKAHETPGKPVDLLALIDPTKHAVKGDWQMLGGILISPPNNEPCSLKIPYKPPEEYQVELVAKPIGPIAPLSFIFVAGTSQASIILGAEGGSSVGIALIDGKWGNENETTRRFAAFSNGKSSRIVYTIRKSCVTVAIDAQTVIDWQGDSKRLSLRKDVFTVPDTRALYLGSFGSYHISKMTLAELSAEGRRGSSLDNYDRGVSLKWEPLRDDQGKLIIGRGPCLSSDDRQLVFFRKGDGGGRDATGLFIARRKSRSSPFSSPERLTQTSPNGGEAAPCFTNEDRVLYFRSSDADLDRPGPWLWRATRPHRDVDFGRGEPAPGVPAHLVGGNRFSPDGNITLLYPNRVKETSPHIVQRRSEKVAFQMEETNLPYWRPGYCSAINPVAIANDGSLVFTWEGEEAMWLCGAKRIDKGTFGSVTRFLALPELGGGHGAVLSTLTHNGRLVISQMNDELIVLRVPEPVAARIAELLGYQQN
jgi:hypothetical protein